jgi:D-inositol-3-phosphate glycosyltransferase
MVPSLKKKIIIIGPAYPYRGGPATYVSYLYKSLSSKFEVKIYNYKLLYPDLLFPGTTQYDESKSVASKPPAERLINSISPINWIKVAARLKKEKADLIVFDWWQPFFGICHSSISLLIKKSYKGKILFITENFISHESRFIDAFLTKIGLSNADIFLALSENVENDLKKISRGRKIFRSSLPPFDCYTDEGNYTKENSRKELDISDSDKVLLFFGYVRKYKGLDILISSVGSLTENHPEIKLLIVGEFYDDVNFYLNMIKDLRLTEKVKLINRFVPNEEVSKYYYASDVVILPYRSATQSAVLNVAYSFGKAVVATKVGGLGEFVKDNETGILVEPESVAALSEGITKYLSLAGKIDFKSNIQKFASNDTFNQLPELFEKIINQSE